MKGVPTIPAFLIIIVASLVGCETEPLIFEGPYFVRFTETTLAARESFSKPIKIEIHNGGPAPKNDVNVVYSVSGSAREGIDYTIGGTRGKARIRSGDYVGTIEIQLINNANNILRSQDIVLSLLTVDYPTLQIGQGRSAIGKTFTLTIQDDCILGGNYYGLRTSTSAPITGITVTSSDCEEYLLSNWDVDIFTFPDIRDLKFIDNGDNTLTIPPQEEETLAEDQATIDGRGVVDPVTRKITMTVRFVDIDTQPEFSFQLIPD